MAEQNGTENGGALEALQRIAEALSNPIRLRILISLAEGEKSISELARSVGISRPLLYMHLSKLERANLIEYEIRHLDKPPYVKKLVKAKKLRITIELPLISLAIQEE